MTKENFEKTLITHFLEHEESEILLLLKDKNNQKFFHKINKNNMYLNFAIDLNLNRVIKKIVSLSHLDATSQNKFLIKSYQKNNMVAVKILLKKWTEDDLKHSFIRELLDRSYLINEEEILKKINEIKMENKRVEYWLEYISSKLTDKKMHKLNSSMLSHYKKINFKWSEVFSEKLKRNCNESLNETLTQKAKTAKLKI